MQYPQVLAPKVHVIPVPGGRAGTRSIRLGSYTHASIRAPESIRCRVRILTAATVTGRSGSKVTVAPLESEPMTELPAKVRAYHLTSTEHAINDISLRRLKVARLSEVNDPFELLGLDCMRKDRRKALADFKNLQDKVTGLLSFSREWDNPVLWSHYARGGRGIALGFDIRNDLGTRGLLEVKYDDHKLKTLGDDPDPISKEFQELLLVTKFKHWEYEKELRVFVELAKTTIEDRLHFYPFDKGLALKEVILGPLCPASLEGVRSLIRATNPGVVISRARLGFKYFEVKENALFPPGI
jgi:hypothetical protein